MNQTTYDETKKQLLDLAESIENAKRPGYTGDNVDVLHNFKTVAAQMGVSPLQAWGIYFLKHTSAITSFAKDQTIPQAEEISGRFADAINYLLLGFALATELGPKPEPAKIVPFPVKGPVSEENIRKFREDYERYQSEWHRRRLEEEQNRWRQSRPTWLDAQKSDGGPTTSSALPGDVLFSTLVQDIYPAFEKVMGEQ